jgi:hypothetical protein
MTVAPIAASGANAAATARPEALEPKGARDADGDKDNGASAAPAKAAPAAKGLVDVKA